MTREEKIKVFEMRLDGYTLQRIANEMGVTRQRIYQILYKRPRRGFKSIYPMLNVWMNDNKETYVSLAPKMGMSKYTISQKLQGEKEFKKLEIDRLLSLTGMTYEEAFALEEIEDK